MSQQQQNDDDDLVITEDNDGGGDNGAEDQGRNAKSKPTSPTFKKKGKSLKSGSTTWQSSIRRNVLGPLLPPPALRAVDRLDARLEPLTGGRPHGTITAATTLLAAWFVLWLLRALFSRKGGKAVAGDDDDAVLSRQQQQQMMDSHYDATALLIGPVGSGKTKLFYRLCHNDSDVRTVMSIRANVGTTAASSGDEDDVPSNSVIRYMDWPGHADLSDPILRPLLEDKKGLAATKTTRIVVVLDATQPVAPAADTFHQLFGALHAQFGGGRKGSAGSPQVPSIFVACHKSDVKGAKNCKRVKIQLRTELERLLRSTTATSASSAQDAGDSVNNGSGTSTARKPWWPPGEPLELDELDFCRLYFGSTSCISKGTEALKELRTFCRTGKLPE